MDEIEKTTTPDDNLGVLDRMQQYADAVDDSQRKFDDALKLAAILLADGAELSKTVKTMGNSQFLRRVSVKTHLTFCEGSLAIMKEMLRQSNPEFDPPLTEVEAGKLDDKSIKRLSPREVRERPWFPNMEDHLLFVSDVLGRVKGLGKFTIERDTDGWNTFFEAVKIRNRLTHPKPYGEMDVTDKEMLTVRDGVQWLTDQFQGFIKVRAENRQEERNATTAALIAEALKEGATEEQVAAFIQRIHPLYKPTASDGGDQDQNSS